MARVCVLYDNKWTAKRKPAAMLASPAVSSTARIARERPTARASGSDKSPAKPITTKPSPTESRVSACPNAQRIATAVTPELLRALGFERVTHPEPDGQLQGA